jgi:uncharacterized protein YuzB (UPF0349 family)
MKLYTFDADYHGGVSVMAESAEYAFKLIEAANPDVIHYGCLTPENLKVSEPNEVVFFLGDM